MCGGRCPPSGEGELRSRPWHDTSRGGTRRRPPPNFAFGVSPSSPRRPGAGLRLVEGTRRSTLAPCKQQMTRSGYGRGAERGDRPGRFIETRTCRTVDSGPSPDGSASPCIDRANASVRGGRAGGVKCVRVLPTRHSSAAQGSHALQNHPRCSDNDRYGRPGLTQRTRFEASVVLDGGEPDGACARGRHSSAQ